jgi:hypothetical protein
MPLSWNEIRDRALVFSREWATECSEDAEAKSFWDSFFNVFGITRRRVASFEAPVKKDDGHGGFIDLLWKGVLLIEHKSRGKDLDRAARQAFDYFPGLKERDLPRYVLVSDFARFRLYDLDSKEQHDFSLADLSKNIKLFGFIAGYQTRTFGQQDPVNIQAAEKLGKLHDLLKSSGYDGHPLEVLLVRILFCMFAEDTALFERCQFQDYLEQRTAEDGSDLGMHLAKLFQVLDTATERRSAALDEQLAAFPYVNGQLFSETLPISDCTRHMREALLDCCALDWSRISPAIFGSLFQSIMDTTARRNLGAHYTSETNILKLIHPLFLDELWAEFHKVKRNRNQLFEFLKKLAHLTFFDPACGCGNFLVIAYRELRLLELEVLRHVRQSDQLMLDVFQLIGVNVDQFHGIEIEEWPARIAEVALWLTDHQMNLKVSEEFGQYYARLPLKKAPHIVHGNALRIDWNDVVPAYRLSYLLGNPPFVGKKEQSAEQKADLQYVFADMKGAGTLDFVTCWYRKSAEYIAENPEIRVAFVSTNSITQGEQVGILWPDLFRRGIRIHFAHRTFQWNNEARGKAAVHCVIVGFGLQNIAEKILYDYETPKSEPHTIKVNRINPYLVDAADIVVEKRMRPLCSVPEMDFGSKAADFGNLVLDDAERNDLLAKYPISATWIRPFLGSEEFINGKTRHCLWLKGVSPSDLKKCPDILARIEKVRIERLKSVDTNTRRWADTPALFQADRQPDTDYLVIPKVSSERRPFIPLGFMSPHYITNPSILVVPNATQYHFGVLQATMHMAWTRSVCGRMKSDYQYSNTIVYNNFPWPEPTEKQQLAIEAAAQGVLDARSKFMPPSPQSSPTRGEEASPPPFMGGGRGEGATLADLYDPLTMPPELVKAHQALDRAVDAAYGKTVFKTEAERVAFLFERYQQLIAPLVRVEIKGKKTRRKESDNNTFDEQSV